MARESGDNGLGFDGEARRHIDSYNGPDKSLPEKVLLLDTTLREGEQHPGVSFTIRQRLQIAWMLDYFGVNAIEISPIVSRDHEESTKSMLKAGLSATIVAHVRALPSDIDVARRCGADWIAMYHSVSDVHLKHKLRVSREEALKRSVEAVEYAKAHGLQCRFTAEDASRADPEFLKTVCKAVTDAGVDRISVPDTTGIMRPMGMYRLVKTVRGEVDTPLDVHCHNDLGLGLANSLAGMEAGASQIHVTINGISERVGLVSLAEASLALMFLYGMKMNVRLNMLQELSQLISSYTGIPIPASMPLVGENAYKHKAGTHVAAVIRSSQAYENIPPNAVGNRRRIIFGELSGKNGAAFLLRILGLNPSPEQAATLAQGLKNLRCGDLFELDLAGDMETKLEESTGKSQS
ncbi:MAG: 2-isopropylmalate synthase [Thaumarchaeota archaeon]|nr:2-isopropylmalate synthase [Nitrososphaerota archaeon]